MPKSRNNKKNRTRKMKGGMWWPFGPKTDSVADASNKVEKIQEGTNTELDKVKEEINKTKPASSWFSNLFGQPATTTTGQQTTTGQPAAPAPAATATTGQQGGSRHRKKSRKSRTRKSKK